MTTRKLGDLHKQFPNRPTGKGKNPARWAYAKSLQNNTTHIHQNRKQPKALTMLWLRKRVRRRQSSSLCHL